MSEKEDPRIEELGRRIREREEQQHAELLRPLDVAEKNALADGVFAEIDAKSQEDRRAPVISIEQATKKSARRRFGMIAALLAATFGMAVVFAVLRKDAPAPMAAYTLSIEGGNQAQRGDPPASDSVLRLDKASRLSLALRPDKPVSGAIAVRGYLVRDGQARPWEPPVVVGAGGVVRIDGTADALLGDIAEGAWDIVLMVGRPDTLPDDAELAKAAAAGSDLPGLSTHRVRVTFSRPRGSLDSNSESTERIGFSGCVSVRAGNECELGKDRTLRIFVPALASNAAIRVDGAALDTAGEPTHGGTRFSIQIPKDARKLEVMPSQPSHLRPVALSFVAADVRPEALIEAEAARRQGDLEQALRLVGDVLDKGPVEAKRQALRQKARILLATPGRFDDAAALFREAILQDKKAGRISDELDDTFALAYGLVLEKRAFAEARTLLDETKPLLAACPEGEPKAAYYKGLIGVETGDLRAALGAFAIASEGAQRLGLDAYRSAVLEQEAEVLAVLGRYDEATARHGQARALAEPFADACRRAQLASNAGWITLRAPGRTKDAKDELEAALALSRKGCPAGVGNVLINLALAKVELGQVQEARALLEEARRAGGWVQVKEWARMLEARIQLAEGRHKDAKTLFDALRADGERDLLPELVFEGSLGRAEALSAAGKRADARQAFIDASKALAAWEQRIPLGEGRGTFLLARQRGARLAVDFFLRSAEAGDEHAAREGMETARRYSIGFVQAFQWIDRVGALSDEVRKTWDEAVAAYRHERAVLEEKAAARGPGGGALETERAALRSALDRALSALGVQKDGNEQAKLSAPDKDEVLFVAHPIRDGWAGFVMADGGRTMDARRLPVAAPSATNSAIAKAWLAPFQPHLSKTRRVRFVLPAELFAMAWHVLPFNDKPLVEHVEVVYSLDLGPRASVGSDVAKAVVIADPTEDLPGARESAGAVVSALESRGFRVISLLGHAATYEAVRNAIEMPGVKLLHYAGHATFDGPDGFEASLRLARRGRFSVADVMTLSHVPDVVVLAGCETSRASHIDTKGEGLGIAQAFVLKGASAAIATPRPIGDTFAADATRLLYAEPVEQAPGSALRTVTRALRRQDPDGEWGALRLLAE